MTPPDNAFAEVTTWGATAAAGVTDSRGTLATTGPAEKPFRWASVTKLLTTLAVLVAVEEGSVSLAQPAGPHGATLRHLLAHASGLAFDDATVVAPPGTRRIYSNHGIEIAARTVAASTGIGFADYLREAVLEPLALRATSVAGSPAWGAIGPLVDLLAIGRELLAPTIVSSALLQEATTIAFAGLDGILPGFGRQCPNDWGLGFEVRDHKHPHWTGTANSPQTFGHFGRSGAFLWVDPTIKLAGAGVADRDFGPWAAASWPALSDAIVAQWGPRS
ncbi:MAG: beta-lactamase family protein [Actinomycetota bacterium]|nr:beta-lactamase family protein [Actinomycetota bacterium]